MNMNQLPIGWRSTGRVSFATLLLVLLLYSLSPLQAEDSPDQQPLAVFLVRHAEKAAQGDDPHLTVIGRLRAAQLAVLLRDSGIGHVHSSNFNRTKGTASPTAMALGLQVQIYNPRDLPSLVAKLREIGGRHLVVGHSNTIPKTVELLGGQAGSPIDESGEYDRLYIVQGRPNGPVGSVMLRYGTPFSKGAAKP